MLFRSALVAVLKLLQCSTRQIIGVLLEHLFLRGLDLGERSLNGDDERLGAAEYIGLVGGDERIDGADHLAASILALGALKELDAARGAPRHGDRHAIFTSAGEASVEVKKKLRQLGFAPEVIRRVSIAMYEGEINMVIHAGGGEAVITVDPDRIVIVLEDHGPGIADIELAMQEGFSTAPDNIRSLGFGAGMGLPNMKRYTDEMKIESELGVGTKITMVVNV